MSNIYTLHSSALPSEVVVAGFLGREALSQPYRFDVAFKLVGIDLDVPSVAGARATLAIDRGPSAPPFVFHGLLQTVELLRDHGSYDMYVARLVPAFWKLALTEHSRIFTDHDIPTIIEAVLRDSGLTDTDYRMNLLRTYPELEHVCQYRESNFAFLSRLMEREGIYYYFEQGDERELLVITDTKSSHAPLVADGVRYFPSAPGDVTAVEALRSFRCRSQMLPGRIKLTDYDYLKPGLTLSGVARVSSGDGEIVVHGAGFKTPKEAARYASIRSEELIAQQTVYTGSGRQFYLRAGYNFRLEDHPRPAFNAEYTAIEVEHFGNQALAPAEIQELFQRESNETYIATVHAIPAQIQFRAARTTPWPRVSSVVDGMIDGPASSPYAQIDAHGRYKVHVFFDESDLVDGSRSTWVRMLQPHGGSVEGHHFPLRKGTEVHLVFLGGDPDRPVIVGVAHNSTKPSAVTQKNYTKNIIRTGSNNYIEMEDLAGATYVHLYSPALNSALHLGAGANNFDLTTDGTGHIHTGVDLNVDVDSNKSEDVGGSITETYQGPFDTTVTNAVCQTYKNTYDLKVTDKTSILYGNSLDYSVKLAATEKYHDTLTLTVVQKSTETFENGREMTVEGALAKDTYNVGHEQTVKAGQLVKVDGGQNVTIKGDKTEDISTNYSLKVSGNLTHTVGGKSTIAVSGPEDRCQWANFDWKVVGAKTDLFAGTSASVFVGAKADITVAAQFSLNIGPTMTISGPRMKLTGPKLDTFALWLHYTAGPRLHLGALSLDVNGLNVIS